MKYEIKELDLGGILDTALSLTKNHLGLLFSLTCILLIPANLALQYVTTVMVPDIAMKAAAGEPFPPEFFVFFAVIFVFMLVAYPLTNAAIVYAVAKLYIGQKTSVGEAFGHALKVALPLLGTAIIFYLCLFAGFALCLIPGIIFSFWFALWSHIVIIERLSGIAALQRSKYLITGSIGNLFVLGILIGVINGGVSFAAQLIPEPITSVVVTVLLGAVLVVFAAAAFVAFYFSCRCKIENFDLLLLAEAVGSEAPAGFERDEDNGF